MEKIWEKSAKLLAQVNNLHQRQLLRPINWEWKLNGIVGARGTGKTTMLLQQLRKLQKTGHKVLYATLDDLYFTENSLYETALEFYQQGGNYLFLDEVHKYKDWSRELKNLYDTLPDLKITFSGSSIAEITRQDVDLSRRALFYELPGLSFREFLILSEGLTYPVYTLDEIFNQHPSVAAEIGQQIRPLAAFSKYLRQGYYPYFVEEARDYELTIEQTLQLVVEVDMKYLEGFDPHQSRKILSLLRILAASAPFKPNISKLSERIGLYRNTLLQYLHYMQKARLVRLLHLPDKDISVLQKPDKVYLDNPNLHYVLNPQKVETGSVRETFLASQLSAKHTLHLHRKADFMVDHEYVIEVGGKGKGKKQIEGLDKAYIAADDIEIGYDNRIPLWLFGMLY